jgi:hypothetical protein
LESLLLKIISSMFDDYVERLYQYPDLSFSIFLLKYI